MTPKALVNVCPIHGFAYERKRKPPRKRYNRFLLKSGSGVKSGTGVETEKGRMEE